MPYIPDLKDGVLRHFLDKIKKKLKKIANLLQKNRIIFFILLLKTKRDNTFIKR